MFEGRKAKKLGLKDLGEVRAKTPMVDEYGSFIRWVHEWWEHASCGGKLREGRDIKTGAHVSLWCPKCKTIVNRGYVTKEEQREADKNKEQGGR